MLILRLRISLKTFPIENNNNNNNTNTKIKIKMCHKLSIFRKVRCCDENNIITKINAEQQWQ